MLPVELIEKMMSVNKSKISTTFNKDFIVKESLIKK